MHRLLMEQKGHAEKLLGNAMKFMPWTLSQKGFTHFLQMKNMFT